MAKIQFNDIASGYLSTDTLNLVLQQIETAFDNTLSRDGTTPNVMEADIDLNGHRLLNSSASESDPLGVPTFATVIEYVNAHSSGLVIQKYQRFVATAAQTVFNITAFDYVPAQQNLSVYVNGVRKFATYDFTETDADTITFIAGLTVGDKVDVYTNDYVSTISFQAHTHTWSEITNIPIYASRWPTYDEVTGKPTTFTPAFHVHDAGDVTTGRFIDARRGVYVQATQPTGLGSGDVGVLHFW